MGNAFSRRKTDFFVAQISNLLYRRIPFGKF